MNAGVNIRAERINRGLSVAAASERIGVSHETLQRAERGGAVPHPRNALKIASFYGYKVTDIWPVAMPEPVSGEAAA